LENIIFIGGDECVKIDGDNYTEHELYTKDCYFYFATDGDCVQTTKAKRSYHQNSICAYGVKDGFNYSGNVDFIEVNCQGFANGNFDDGVCTYNGSTAHVNSRGIRVNCKYWDNKGGQVIDVINSKSVNLGCIAYDSKSTVTSMAQGMGSQAQGTDDEMWFVGCVCFGNEYDFYCKKGATIHIEECQYDTINSSGTIYADDRL
jgi:hypothetical protein